MKKLFKNLSLILIVSFGIALLNSCVTETTGTVIVRNNAPYKLKVDVTWGGATTNHERWVSPGSSTTYYSVPEGMVRIWSSDTGLVLDWLSDDIFLNAGQTYTYTLDYKKSNAVELFKTK